MANYEDNKWTLVYDGAIEENAEGAVNLREVRYPNNIGLEIAANLYLPADYSEDGSYAAIVVAHPNGGVKEQVSGLFAQRLAGHGYVALAYDAAYQGASAGEPRQTDRPASRVEDIRASIDYLAGVPGVDASRIGALGICGGGGYTIAATVCDKRIKAAATIGAFNSGRVRRNGFKDGDLEGIPGRLSQAAEARAKWAATGEVVYVGNETTAPVRFTDEQLAQIPAGLYRDGAWYYGDHYFHPRSQSRYTAMSLQDLMAFDAEDSAALIEQPLLMMVGDVADTRYMTEGIFEKVSSEDKELTLIPGASHIEAYWKPEYVDAEEAALVEFFGRVL